MSTTRLMILGLISWLQPVHGYDVRRELLSWDVESWANIQPGSIYHALRKLTEEGMLAEVATEQVGARPTRTTYRITPKGEDEFQALLRKYWWDYKEPFDPFLAAYAFLPALPRAEAVAALRHRARTLETRLLRARTALESDSEWARTKPQHVLWNFELTIARLEAEIAWCDRVAERIQAGEGFQAHEPAYAEVMRAWRTAMSKDATEETRHSREILKLD